MKKYFFLIMILSTAMCYAQSTEKLSVAILGFNPKSKLPKADIKKISSMFTASLHKTNRCAIAEKSQVTQVLNELGYQPNGLSANQFASIGKK